MTHVEAVSTQQPVVAEPTGCDKWRPIVQKYGWDSRVAMAVLEAESHCHSDSVGDTWVIAGVYAPSCGLLQVRTLPGRPSCEQLKDPDTNVAFAYGLYKAHGFQPWTMYNNGEYLKYLK